MPQKNIELELRAKINKSSYNRIFKRLKREAKLISHTSRLAAMFFGKVNKNEFDIRIRITDGKSEIVVKKGNLHAHNRTEAVCPINKSQFIQMVRLFDLFDFKAKVSERETYNFNLGNKIIFSLVKAGPFYYLEIEKMTSHKDLKKNKKILIDILKGYNIKPITRRKEYDDLCNKLTKHFDWEFKGSRQDYNKLKKLLSMY